MIAGLCLSACSEHDGGIPVKEAEDISLSAVVDEVEILSRASNDGAYTGTVPSDQNVLEAAVWFSLESGTYKHDPQGETNLPVHTQIDYKSGTATFPTGTDESTKPKYPTNADTPVYCVGFYPNSGWSNPENNYKKATHTITGTQDLMFAPQISGNLNHKFETQRYRHLLTWLKVCVCAASAEAGSYWGDLKQVVLKDVATTLTIDLTKSEEAESLENKFDQQRDVVFSDSADVNIFNNSNGIPLEITPKEVASVFCQPKAPTPPTTPAYTYQLDLICANGQAVDVPIKLQALNAINQEKLNYPAGLQYVLTLYFHPFNVVEGVCTLNAWNAQNEDLYPN